jgi:hypothetical protein
MNDAGQGIASSSSSSTHIIVFEGQYSDPYNNLLIDR